MTNLLDKIQKLRIYANVGTVYENACALEDEVFWQLLYNASIKMLDDERVTVRSMKRRLLKIASVRRSDKTTEKLNACFK